MAEPLPTVAQIGAEEYRLRMAAALRKIAVGEITQAHATQLMAPWTAIALLSRAEVPELVLPIEEARATIVHYPGNGAPAVYGHKIPEDDARILLASSTCGPNVWGPTLCKARDAALARAITPDAIRRARNLCRLAAALDVPLTAASCAPPRGAAPERKAA